MRALAMMVVGGLLSSCSCTLMACADGVQVTLRAPDGWALGEWTVDAIGSDGGESRCAFEISDDSAQCPGATPCVLFGDDCDGFGGVLHRDDGTIEEIFLNAAITDPEITWVVGLDGTELLREATAPAFRENAPNGEQCGPVCTSAHTDLDVPTP